MTRTVPLLLLIALPLAADTSGRRGSADPNRFQQVAAYECRQKIWMLSPGGRWYTSKNGNDVGVFEARTGKRHGLLKGHAASLHDAGWSRDGRTLATAGYDGAVKVWDVPTLREIVTIPAHVGYS